MNQKVSLLQTFRIPLIIVIGINVYLFLQFSKLDEAAAAVGIFITLLGSFRLFVESYRSLLKKQYALDYIAILAILVALVTQEYLVAAILALMISSGRTLEDYGVAQAKKSLTKLSERIPDEVHLWQNGEMGQRIKIENVKKGTEIYIRKGEVVGLDGTLVSDGGLTDESSITSLCIFWRLSQ